VAVTMAVELHWMWRSRSTSAMSTKADSLENRLSSASTDSRETSETEWK
jgi:hypothetical protein